MKQDCKAAYSPKLAAAFEELVKMWKCDAVLRPVKRLVLLIIARMHRTAQSAGVILTQNNCPAKNSFTIHF